MATGVAAVEAATDLIREMRSRVALLWDTSIDKVSYDGGEFTRSSGAEKMGIKELAAKLGQTGGAVRGKGDVNVRKWGGSFTAHIADVEVDNETGKVRVLRYTAIQDVGRAVHPTQVEGQIRGGVTQGIGWALYEGCRFDQEGRMLNPHYLDYKMPTFLDVPPIEPVIVEVPWPDHPFGVRGVGEIPIVPPPAAIANAINRAFGIRPVRLPMTPAGLLEAKGII
jgi:CO/xanthine dehydrogenase Mo-binding subunit